ncbi:lysozyme inhibitor LprI family protein [Paracoccus tegillarcae]|uniref:Lysozyme inhibitor LprI-like N-terminal domain-containing protein n=1 Tax=Paracoccus tegillarcae TaxID=1529068 RepID=A0A2K9EZF3_9RHOB|nr:lysozyme inhibitor LprI family protein [Paracoccus tegillarcae]AUH32271.1 hypothetical protein CUV01_01640 [Paracoccus tegillarcae]
MMRYPLLALLLLSAPLAAQEASVEPGAVEACFDATARGEGTPDCVGNAASACSSAQEQPDTTFAISQCMMAETNDWDSLLNREYQKTRDAFSDQPGLADALLTAQRAWIAFRDADCTLAYDRYGDGSMRVISAADCRMRHTAQRTFQLRDLQGF